MTTKTTRAVLSDDQLRKWAETWTALPPTLDPEKGELAAVFTEDVPIAATDGTKLALNPAKFFEFTLDERVFIVTHEILHMRAIARAKQ